MNKGRPFFFDSNIFDALSQPTAEELEKAPKYTEEQMMLARSAAFNEGKKAGVAEIQASVDKEISAYLSKIDAHLTKFYAVESVRFERYEAESIHLAYQILKYLFPLMFEKIGEDQLFTLLKETIQSQRSNCPLEITIHESKISSVTDFLQKSILREGKITLSPSSTIGKNDCLVNWEYGGVILAPEKAAQKIVALMKEALAEREITVHDGETDGNTTL